VGQWGFMRKHTWFTGTKMPHRGGCELQSEGAIAVELYFSRVL